MKLTKYEHACIVLEEQGKKLVIDPGSFTAAFGNVDNIAAVVVTHIHQDHFNAEHLDAIIKNNPDVRIFSTAEVAEAYQKANVSVAVVGERITVGPFALDFAGERHAFIHKTIPEPQNVAVMVNDIFFDPGDSYTMPKKPVTLLAVPANAPWMRVAESMDYIAAVKPQRCLPTHNGLLSDNGNTIYNGALGMAAKEAGASFMFLKPGDSTEV